MVKVKEKSSTEDKIQIEREVLKILEEVKDPELPFLSLTDLLMIRRVQFDEESGEVEVFFTPSFTGCPALSLIKEEISDSLERSGFFKIKITDSFNPPWDATKLPEKTKNLLRKNGYAAPHDKRCPYCQSTKIRLVSNFSSTSCKKLFQCREESCQMPFEEMRS